MVSDVFEEVLRDFAGISAGTELPPIEVPQAEREATERVFREQMTTYDSHWRDDPVFDYTNTAEVAGHLPCPVADRSMLVKTSRFAVAGNFGWPRPLPVQLEFDAAAALQPLVEAGSAAGNRAPTKHIGLQITGPGGGGWSVAIDGAQPLWATAGLGEPGEVTYHLNSRTFSALSGRQISVEQAIYSGSVVVEGHHPSERGSIEILRKIAVPVG
jgi:hypothetical protein